MAFTLAFHIILVPLGVSWSVMAHEFGHGTGGLADEYCAKPGTYTGWLINFQTPGKQWIFKLQGQKVTVTKAGGKAGTGSRGGGPGGGKRSGSGSGKSWATQSRAGVSTQPVEAGQATWRSTRRPACRGSCWRAQPGSTRQTANSCGGRP